ncbi:DUF805 domain-containing protein [Demequina sp. NBRC 110054]|uniref:DUF805 domain-containing protein n=1 Tax=Demequina sp. NBRC 110054 TaxID=1570343 RepID=UPI0009FCD247|nr:DUF805 domain-containing protein [Demequina sp. NBRC 110054]
MGFGEAIKVCFSKYADFSGRARRSEYWWFQLFIFLIEIPFQIVFWILYAMAFAPVFSQAEADGTIPESAFDDFNVTPLVIGSILLLAVAIALFLPSLAVVIRRLHDTGRSGWWILLGLIPGGSIVIFVFTILDSEPGTNAYGPNPKGAEWGHIPMTPPPAPGQPMPPTSSDPFQP